MVETGACAKNIFRLVEKNQILDMHHKAYGYIGLIGIANVGNKVLTNPLVVSAPQNLSGSTQEVKIP